MLPQKIEGIAARCRFAARPPQISDCPFFEGASRSRTRCGESSVLAAAWERESSGSFWNGVPAVTMLLPLTDELLNI